MSLVGALQPLELENHLSFFGWRGGGDGEGLRPLRVDPGVSLLLSHIESCGASNNHTNSYKAKARLPSLRVIYSSNWTENPEMFMSMLENVKYCAWNLLWRTTC